MHDEELIPDGCDRVEINPLYKEYELRYWSQKFGVTPDRLVATLKEVGPMLSDVITRLRREP